MWNACRSIRPALWEEMGLVCSSMDGESASNSAPAPRTPGVFVGLRENTFHLYTTSVHTLKDGWEKF